MNKVRLTWGIICLALAIVTAVFYFVVPEVEIVFKLFNVNLYYIPIIILAVAGILLLVTGRR